MQEEQQLTKLRQLNSHRELLEVQHNLDGQAKKTERQNKENNKNEQESEQGSEHGHEHGQSCKHHGKKKSSSKQHRTHQKNYCIIFYCIFTCFSCVYLEVSCFYPLQENEHSRRIKTFLSCFVVFLALWSYFQTIRTKNNVIKLKGVPNIIDVPNTDSNYLVKQCQQCKYYKVPRVSHCSTCGTCIMKLDHHCMWTQNCIGYRNQRPFYLFTLYMSIGLYQYWAGAISTFLKMYGSCKFFSFFQPGVYILWIMTCFSAFFVGMMIVALFISHTFMILTNHTTLMSMKFKRMCPFPFCEFRDMILQDEYINPFDRGQIQNAKSLFGTNIFTAFLPFTRQPDHDFLFEASNPIPTKGQISSLSGGAEAQINRDQELKKTIMKVKQLYKGQKFKFKDQILEPI